MNEEVKKKKLYKKLKNKYRLVILNDTTYEEKVSLRLSPLNLFTIIGSFALILILAVAVIIVFTPVRQWIPGYADVNLRKDAIDLAIKTDSADYAFEINRRFIENIQNIMLGNVKDTVIEGTNDSNMDYNSIEFTRVPEDSALRDYVESEDQYNLPFASLDESDASDISSFSFFTPLNGTITSTFDMKKNHFGLDIVAAENEAVKATLKGTVTFSEWTAETGYVIQIQHDNNLLSIYKHNSVLLKKAGDYVKAGEAIAIIGNSGDLSTGPHLHFELWYNGYPMNPENYMIF